MIENLKLFLKRGSFGLVFVFSIFSCSAYSQRISEYPNLVEAIKLQGEIVSAPIFKEVLRELESSGEIIWKGRTKLVKEDLSAYSSNTEWAIERFEKDGVYTSEQIKFFAQLFGRKKTKAKTIPCNFVTKLNRNGLKEKKSFAVLRTLIHERSHSFCQKHKTQKRKVNMCDFSYVSGDLAESILVSLHGDESYKLPKPMCPALCNSLAKRGMSHSCDLNILQIDSSCNTGDHLVIVLFVSSSFENKSKTFFKV